MLPSEQLSPYYVLCPGIGHLLGQQGRHMVVLGVNAVSEGPASSRVGRKKQPEELSVSRNQQLA